MPGTTELTTGFLYIGLLYDFAFNTLIWLYHLLGDNLGLSIIVFTISLRLITLPFSLRQQATAEKSREFQDKYKEIQEKYKKKEKKKDSKKQKEDRDAEMAKELAKLQGEYLPAQLAGCLPLILQLVFFFQVYYVLINLINVGPSAFNLVNYPFISQFPEGAVFDLNFLGINLGESARSIGYTNWVSVWPYYLLVGLVGLSQFSSTKIMMGLRKTDNKESDGKSNNSGKPKKNDRKTETEDKPELDLSFQDAMQQASQNMIMVLPIMTMFIALNFPAGLAIYWTITSGFIVFQQGIVHREKIINWFKSRNSKENSKYVL